MTFAHLMKEVSVEFLSQRSIILKEVADIVIEDGENLMAHIREYLISGLLPKDPKKDRKARRKAPQYRLIEGNLYQMSFSSPWLQCIGHKQAANIIQEVNQCSYGFHACPRPFIAKITMLGYYWPSMHRDAVAKTQRCEAC